MAHGNFYFAWVDPTDAFNPTTHNREDEDVFAFSMDHSEGDFAQAKVSVRNPRVGLLKTGRKVWAYLSYQTASAVVPFFFGRLVGIPSDIFEETCTFDFIGRPANFEAQKAALAASSKSLPEYDPIFISPENWDDPDAILEARTELWHIDPVTHVVSLSDIIVGEDGSEIYTQSSDIIQGSVQLTLADSPITTCQIQATIPWLQSASGGIDITGTILNAAAMGASTNYGGLIASYTIDGLISSWPKAGTNFGSGWRVASASATDASAGIPYKLTKNWSFFNGVPLEKPCPDGTLRYHPSTEGDIYGGVDGAGYDLTYSEVFAAIGYARVQLSVAYTAARDYAEIVVLTLATDMQPIITAPDDGSTLVVKLSANPVSDITEGGSIPIGDVRRRSYFDTARGEQSVQHLILLARANLVAKARAISISFTVPFERGLVASLRKNAEMDDPRIPGGTAVGKIVGRKLEMSGSSGTALATITIACTVGYGGAITPVAGSPTYCELAYCGSDYQALSNSINLIGTSDVGYTLPVPAPNDDGLDFLRGLSNTEAILSCTIANKAWQQAAILSSVAPVNQLLDEPTYYLALFKEQGPELNAVKKALQDHETSISVTMRPLGGGPFISEIDVGTTPLIIPKQIDLEAS